MTNVSTMKQTGKVDCHCSSVPCLFQALKCLPKMKLQSPVTQRPKISLFHEADPAISGAYITSRKRQRNANVT